MSDETRYAAQKRAQEDARSNTPQAISDRATGHRISRQVREESRIRRLALGPAGPDSDWSDYFQWVEDRYQELRHEAWPDVYPNRQGSGQGGRHGTH